MMKPQILPPERLSAQHDFSSFRNGEHPSLDDWLRDRALACEGLSARTYVVCAARSPTQVVGYYAITTAMEQRVSLPNAKLRRGMPEQIPLLLIGRLALDHGYHGIGLGTDLLSDALRRCLYASEIAGVRGVVVHAIDDYAAGFYRRHGLGASPRGGRTGMMPIAVVRDFSPPTACLKEAAAMLGVDHIFGLSWHTPK
jgi:GNAT superfamily N-acetyltransferase